MEASSSIGKSQGAEVSSIQFVRSDTCPQPKFHDFSEIAMKGDSMGVISLIPPKVIMIHYVWSLYMCKVGEAGDYEICEAYEKLCEEGILKEELKFIERKGFTHALEFPINFKIKWIKFVLRRIHNMKFWMHNG